jgi:hypothetical protein
VAWLDCKRKARALTEVSRFYALCGPKTSYALFLLHNNLYTRRTNTHTNAHTRVRAYVCAGIGTEARTRQQRPGVPNVLGVAEARTSRRAAAAAPPGAHDLGTDLVAIPVTGRG